jgi:hypothetical protein
MSVIKLNSKRLFILVQQYEYVELINNFAFQEQLVKTSESSEKQMCFYRI